MTLPRLPASLDTINIPRYLPPSRLVELRECPLKVLVDPDETEGSLPHRPSALLGVLLHHVREQLLRGNWGDARLPENAFETILRSATDQLDDLLARDDRTRRLAPIARALGRVRWNVRTDVLRHWAKLCGRRPTGNPPAPLTMRRRTATPADNDETPRIEFGPEAWIVAPSLRLRGRVDQIARHADNAVEITDFKSGVVLDDDDRPLERHVDQVRLYGLAVESVLDGPREVRLFIQGRERFAVEWNDQFRQECVLDLDDILGGLPANAKLDARELGHPGSWCRSCRIRPVCPAYIGVAPSCWRDRGRTLRPLPLDVWGRVKDVSLVAARVRIEIIDPAGRSNFIEGLDPRRFLDEHLGPGDELYLFDLEPTEPTVQHGVPIHPRNFHELPPDGGLRMSQARSLQIYRG